jgi:hypothetical protein
MKQEQEFISSVLSRTELAAAALASIMQDVNAPAPARVSAARYILDYSFKSVFGDVKPDEDANGIITIVDDM